MNITLRLLIEAVDCSIADAQLYAPLLDEACQRFEINNGRRVAHFLAQTGHESVSFHYTTEVWGPTTAQLTYENRANLGNTQRGDGARFKGHGLIQTTGRFNHAKARDGLRQAGYEDVPDFEDDPGQLALPQWAARSAALFWRDHGCNELADADNFLGIVHKVNGGENGLADRTSRLARARTAVERALQLEAAAAPAPVPGMPAGEADPGPAEPDPTPVDPVQPDPIVPAPTAPPPQEAPMGTTFLMGLAKILFNVFSPLAAEKIEKEVARHTSSPEVAQQVAQAAVDAAMQLTGKADPVEAVVAAKAQPELVKKIEDTTLATLDKLAPVLDKLAQWDQQAWNAEEASRDAAAKRAATDPNNQDVFLTRSIVLIVVGLLVACGALIGLLAWLKFDSGTTAMVSLFTTLAGIAVGKFNTRYDYSYGSSRGSSGKDVVINELSRRPGGRP